MNWTLEWTRPNFGLVGIGILLLGMAVLGLQRWPRRSGARIFLRGLLGATAVPVVAAAMLRHLPPPLTMSECVSTLGSGPASSPTGVAPANDPPAGWIGVGTGPIDQTYYLVAKGLEEVARAAGIPLVIISTKGSQANLARAASQENMALAFTQSDALEAATPDQQKRLRMVMSLYREEVHVLARRQNPATNAEHLPGGPIRRLADLVGLRVLVSERSGGSEYTANRLLELSATGNPSKTIKKVQAVPAADAICSVLTGSAAAMIVVAGQPVGQLRELQRFANHPAQPLKDVQFLPVSAAELHASKATGISSTFYEPAGIERRSYPWAFESEPGRDQVETVAVRALLMAYDFSPRRTVVQQQKCAAVSAVSRLLRDPDVIARLCQLPHHRKWCQLDPSASVPGWEANKCN